MLFRPITLAILACLSCLASAQGAFITFHDEGPRELWVQAGLASEPPADSVRTERTSIQFSLDGKRPTDALYVWDKKRGNLASRMVKDVKAEGKWDVKDSDYIDVAEVLVQVQHSGAPVAAAQVTLNDGRRKQQELLDPSLKGDVRFFAVKPGTLKVTVQYKSEGKDAKPVTQMLDAPLKRADAVPTLVIALPSKVETVAGAASASPPDKPNSTTNDKEEVAPTANIFGSFLTYAIGLGLALGLGWFALQYFKKNPDTVSAKLEQLGVQIPKPQDDALTGAGPVVPAPIKQAPPQKIILDDAAVPDPSLAPISVAAPVMTGQPRLVSETGDEMPLSEGELVVGREVGLGLSLIGEATVSRRHAQLMKTGDLVVVKDLGSTNGTYVNGVKVDTEVTLRPGDTVQFGSVRFRYQG